MDVYVKSMSINSSLKLTYYNIRMYVARASVKYPCNRRFFTTYVLSKICNKNEVLKIF